MASSSTFLLFFSLSLLFTFSYPQQNPPPLNSFESESVYLALESVNPETPWRSLYPDDLCLSSPHGVVCSYFSTAQNDTVLIPHITELNFGYVSDSSPNPACSSRASFPSSLSSLPHLRKVLFYRCFSASLVSLDSAGFGFGSELEEFILIENPALSGSLGSGFRNLSSLRRFILTGSNVSGGIPDEITKLPSLEQLTISGNSNLGGGIPVNIGTLKKLKILDLSSNGLKGNIPEPLGQLGNLMKLDLSYNHLVGRIPESLMGLKNVEFLDLRYNKFGNFGVPLFLAEMGKLKEVYLSGNLLGGAIPEIWEHLGGILGIGLSGVGLVGNIPSSMGVFLRNVSYIGLDNNKLEGVVPEEFGLLPHVNEVNLRNNHLSGKIPFSVHFAARVGKKLKLEGNLGLCIDKSMRWSVEKIGSGLRSLRTCNSTSENPNPALLANGTSSPYVSWFLLILLGVIWSI